MTKYEKPYLVEDSGVPNVHILNYKWRERKTDRFIFFRGEWVEPTDFELIFHSSTTLEKQTQYDCIPNNAAVLLVNERALKILEDICPGDFQAFDATIVSEDHIYPSFEVKNYKLSNIIKEAETLDEEKSSCTYFESGKISFVNKLTFKENCIKDIKLAREKKIHSFILASESLKKAFTKAKIRGVKFLRDDQW